MSSTGSAITIVIIGGSLGGTATLWELERKFKKLDANFLVIEKNQDFVFHDVAPRAMVSGKQWADNAIWGFGQFKRNNCKVQKVEATVLELHPRHLVLHDGKTVSFDYCVIATGCHASECNPFVPIRVKSRNQGIDYFSTSAKQIKDAASVVLVGGGPSACELAAEIKLTYPEKHVTLIHSRPTMLSSDTYTLSTKNRLESKLRGIGIDIVLGDRVVDLPSDAPYRKGRHIVRTAAGREIESHLTYYCISKPNPATSFLKASQVLRKCLDSKGFVSVHPTLQINIIDSFEVAGPNASSETLVLPDEIDQEDEQACQRIFAMGDVAATGAPKMTRVLRNQAYLVAFNIYTHHRTHSAQDMKIYKPPKDDLIGVPLGRMRGVVQIGFLPEIPIVTHIIDMSIGFIKNNSVYTFVFSKIFGYSAR